MGGVEWSGVGCSESKFSDHSPTIAGSVWIVGSVQIVGELINYCIFGGPPFIEEEYESKYRV